MYIFYGNAMNSGWTGSRYDVSEVKPAGPLGSSPSFTAKLECVVRLWNIPDSKVHGANMGPIWGRQDPDGTHVGPMNYAIWDGSNNTLLTNKLVWRI